MMSGHCSGPVLRSMEMILFVLIQMGAWMTRSTRPWIPVVVNEISVSLISICVPPLWVVDIVYRVLCFVALISILFICLLLCGTSRTRAFRYTAVRLRLHL